MEKKNFSGATPRANVTRRPGSRFPASALISFQAIHGHVQK